VAASQPGAGRQYARCDDIRTITRGKFALIEPRAQTRQPTPSPPCMRSKITTYNAENPHVHWPARRW
jgi:hypothetical protein